MRAIRALAWACALAEEMPEFLLVIELSESKPTPTTSRMVMSSKVETKANPLELPAVVPCDKEKQVDLLWIDLLLTLKKKFQRKVTSAVVGE